MKRNDAACSHVVAVLSWALLGASGALLIACGPAKVPPVIQPDLRAVLEARHGEAGYHLDDETLEIVVALKVAEHKPEFEPFTLESKVGAPEEGTAFTVNGQVVPRDEAEQSAHQHLADLQADHMRKRAVREEELRRFLVSAGIEIPADAAHPIQRALGDANGTVRLSLTKAEIIRLAVQHQASLQGVELFYEPQFDNGSYPPTNPSADMSPQLAAIGLSPWWRGQPGVGVYMRDAGCFQNSTTLPLPRFQNPDDVAPQASHPFQVAWTVGQATTQSSILCDSNWYTPPTTLPVGFPPIQIANHSWGAPTNAYNIESKNTDAAVQSTGIATFVSAGNQGSGTSSDKAAGYNVIAVGNWDSVGGGMNPSSSSGLVSNTGLSKPDISAPGTTVPNPWGPWTGTSVSSPIAAGAGADLAGFNPGFGYAPTMKALMMVVSSRGATGANHSGPTNSIVADKDGVGIIALTPTIDLGCRHYSSPSVDSSSVWTSNVNGLPTLVLPLQMIAGQRYRLAVTWMVDADFVYELISRRQPGRPNMNVDLFIIPPAGGSPVAASRSATNNWEMVEFTAATTGTYSLNLQQVSSAHVGPLMMAWCISPGNV